MTLIPNHILSNSSTNTYQKHYVTGIVQVLDTHGVWYSHYDTYPCLYLSLMHFKIDITILEYKIH